MSELLGAQPPLTWVLADDRPGNVNQALGVAEALGWAFAVKQVRYRPLAAMPNWALPTHASGLTDAALAELAPPWPGLVIAAGRRTAPVARWIKAQQQDAFLVQVMWPGSAADLDLIAVPEHDRPPLGPELLRTEGSPHRLTPAVLARASAALAPSLADLRRPLIACLVGGSNKHGPFTADDASRLGRQASALATSRGGSLLITTSRRTGAACEDALAAALTVPHRLHRWRPDGDNPYLGYLASADALVVTGDSASMCTEAAATGRPVFLFLPAAGVPAKLARLHARLDELGHVRPLGAPWFEVATPLPNPAAIVANEIRARLSRRNSASWRSAMAASDAAL
jgi:hypothetical protein